MLGNGVVAMLPVVMNPNGDEQSSIRKGGWYSLAASSLVDCHRELIATAKLPAEFQYYMAPSYLKIVVSRIHEVKIIRPPSFHWFVAGSSINMTNLAPGTAGRPIF